MLRLLRGRQDVPLSAGKGQTASWLEREIHRPEIWLLSTGMEQGRSLGDHARASHRRRRGRFGRRLDPPPSPREARRQCGTGTKARGAGTSCWSTGRRVMPANAPSHCSFGCWCVVEEVGIGSIHLYSQAFSASGADVDGFEFAAFYTLQDGLA